MFDQLVITFSVLQIAVSIRGLIKGTVNKYLAIFMIAAGVLVMLFVFFYK